MYPDLVKFPITHEKLKWEAREALLDVDGQPRLFVRIKLTGTKFVQRAPVPQVWVGEVFARHVEIDDDERTVRAYFDRAPREGTLYFGYNRHAELSFGPFESRRIAVLDRARLPKEAQTHGGRRDPG